MNYFLMLFFTGGLSLAVSGAAKLVRNCQLQQSAIEAKGTITGYEKKKNYRKYSYAPIVVFFTSERQRVEFTGEIVSRKRKKRVGESVSVLYHPMANCERMWYLLALENRLVEIDSTKHPRCWPAWYRLQTILK